MIEAKYYSCDAVSIIDAMEESMDMIKYLIRNSGSDPDNFDYYVNIADHAITLYDYGFPFATYNIEYFHNPGGLMQWVAYALNEYYYEEDAEDVQ